MIEALVVIGILGLTLGPIAAIYTLFQQWRYSFLLELKQVKSKIIQVEMNNEHEITILTQALNKSDETVKELREEIGMLEDWSKKAKEYEQMQYQDNLIRSVEL